MGNVADYVIRHMVELDHMDTLDILNYDVSLKVISSGRKLGKLNQLAWTLAH